MDFASLIQNAVPALINALFGNRELGVPLIVLVSLGYLLLNDLLDVVIVVRSEGLSKATTRDVVAALAADVNNRAALGLGSGAALTALSVGGNFQAAFIAALAGVAAANVGSFEASTLTKLKMLFAKRPAPPVGPNVPPVKPFFGQKMPPAPPVGEPGGPAVPPGIDPPKG